MTLKVLIVEIHIQKKSVVDLEKCVTKLCIIDQIK
jgi:hypothetical protein